MQRATRTGGHKMSDTKFSKREFLKYSAALPLAGAIALNSKLAFAGKIKVAGIYTQPIQQKWDARLHQALDAAAKAGEIEADA